MLRRSNPDTAPGAVFTDRELEVLDASSGSVPERVGARSLDFYMRRVARLAGFLARRHDAPPGATVLWRGFSRLADLAEGFATPKTQPGLMGN